MSEIESILTQLRSNPNWREIRRQMEISEVKAEAETYAKTLTLGHKISNAAKWIAGIVVVIFTMGATWQSIASSNATINDVDNRVEPIEQKVYKIENDVQAIKIGVDKLITDAEQDKTTKSLRARLAEFDAEYNEALSEYVADKMSGKFAGPRPRKSPEHLELSALLKEKKD